MDLVIYGAQGMALGVYEALNKIYPRRKISCFLVTNRENNATSLGGIPVYELAAFAGQLSGSERKNVDVLIAAPEDVQTDIEESLEDFGFMNHRGITSKRFAELLCLFHVKEGQFLPLKAVPIGSNMPFLRIYMARCQKDKVLRKQYDIPEYMIPLQVGTELADTKVADRFDNQGINISGKNGNYSELSGLYWLWKNKLNNCPEDTGRQYLGFMQYRRFLELDEDDKSRLILNDIDVVLPYPMPYEPNIAVHHERYLKTEDWNALLTAISQVSPEYAKYFPKVLEQRYLYNYNIILAKKSVLRDYCEWLFPILERTEELSSPKGADRSDRYIGYMGEVLETLYFMKNREVLNIVHTMCRFLV